MITASLVCLLIFFLVRNEIVFSIRARAIWESDSSYDEYIIGPSYEAMIFQVSKWTYRQFYPRAAQTN